MVLCEDCFNTLHPNEIVTDAKKLESNAVTKLMIAAMISGTGYFIFLWGILPGFSSVSLLLRAVGLIIGFFGLYLIYRARKF